MLTTVYVTTETSATTVTTTTTTVTTTTTEETSTTETEAPVEEVSVVRKTTAVPVENEPENEPDPEPVKTEAPKVEEPEPTEDPGYYYCWDEDDNYNYGRKIYTKPVTMYIISDRDAVDVLMGESKNDYVCWVIDRGSAVNVYSERDGYAFVIFEGINWAGTADESIETVRGYIPLENLSLVKVDYPAPTA